MASAEAAPAAVQTVVLRVSIHCQGCKKKVRKVLKGVEGVQNVAVDGAQHKVTVTGTVDANTLIKRLYKSGKQAMPWHPGHAAPAKTAEAAPVPAPASEAKPTGDGVKDDAAAAAAADKKPEEPVKESVKAESSEKKPEQEAEKKPEAEKGAESTKEEKKEETKPSDEAKKDAGEGQAAEQKAKGDEPAKEPAADAAKEGANGEDDAKKNKSSKPAVEAEPVATAERSLPAQPPPAAPKHAYGRYEEYHHQPYYAPQPVVSYNMAQPRTSVSYYAPQPQQAYSVHQHPPPPPSPPRAQPMQQWSPSYLYMPYPHASPESYYRDHDYYSPPGTHAPPPPLQDSYRLFDDENPNSCTVM
ncbi:hypothetical protein ACP70R_048759 [Stipagrostis hirtigluma subsp. patula]